MVNLASGRLWGDDLPSNLRPQQRAAHTKVIGGIRPHNHYGVTRLVSVNQTARRLSVIPFSVSFTNKLLP